MNPHPTWDVLVVGSINTDFLVVGPKLPLPGETVTGDLFQEAPGGKGANQAVAAARLGARVALIANAGHDERGDRVLAHLRDNRVDTTLVARDEEADTGAALVQVERGGQKAIMTSLGANRRLAIPTEGRLATAVASARVLLTQLEIPLATVEAAVRLARAAGVQVVLDPAPAQPLSDQLLRDVTVIRPNAREAGALTGVEVNDRGSARWAADLLLARGPTCVAVQAGEEGNLLVWQEGALWLPKIAVQTVDATGAGDAFAAALAVALAEGRPFSEAGPFASAAAALATTALGAQAGLPSRAAVMDLLSRLQPRERPTRLG